MVFWVVVGALLLAGAVFTYWALGVAQLPMIRHRVDMSEEQRDRRIWSWPLGMNRDDPNPL